MSESITVSFDKTDFEKYKGKWIAVLDGKIISSGKVIGEVYREALKTSGEESPLFEYIPEKAENWIF